MGPKNMCIYYIYSHFAIIAFGIFEAIYISGVRSDWVGRRCCEYAVDNRCRKSCTQSKSISALKLRCVEDLEDELFGCIVQLQKKKRCCRKSLNVTITCLQVCSMSFRSRESLRDENYLHEVELNCPTEIVRCTRKYLLPSRKISNEVNDSIQCCDRSSSESCRNGCKEIMTNTAHDSEKMDSLVEICGEPIPRQPLWKCLMYAKGHSTRPAPPSVGLELECCARAVSVSCRELCKELYSHPWKRSSNWQYFQHWCKLNSDESKLRNCLQEVKEPCKMGCTGLSFCTNFNHRTTESFQSCNSLADAAARTQIREWKKGIIRHPMAEFPVMDIDTCHPEKWKAIACALEVKPCITNSASTTICHKDCVALLNDCADFSRFDRSMTVKWLCDIFSPLHMQSGCLSLSKYSVQTGHTRTTAHITLPCNPNPCGKKELCVVNRDECKHSTICPHFKCLPGCKISDTSHTIAYVGQRVKIPDVSRGVGCYRVCTCTSAHKLQFCDDLHCLHDTSSCLVGGHIKIHGSRFKIDCNLCTCHDGNVICSKRQCVSNNVPNYSVGDCVGLACNCSRSFLPVCARNGQTFPNVCLARCMGHSEDEIEFGPCKTQNPCKSKPCKRSEQCIKANQACVTSSAVVNCLQYKCVTARKRCSRKEPNSSISRLDATWNDHNPICAINDTEHQKLCYWRRKHQNRKVVYTDKCRKSCNKESTYRVCGQNMVTYDSVCEAFSDRVLIDYKTPCSVSAAQDDANIKFCHGVNCEKLSNPDCEPIIAPGACCPVCGGMLRILYSQENVNSIAKMSVHGPITILDIVLSLRRHLEVKECDIYGHLTVEGDIVTLIVPTVETPTLLQIEACLGESERLARFINERNPIFSSDVMLSTLLAAEVYGRSNLKNGALGIRLGTNLKKITSHLKTIFLNLCGISETGVQVHNCNKTALPDLLIWMAKLLILHQVQRKMCYSEG